MVSSTYLQALMMTPTSSSYFLHWPNASLQPFTALAIFLAWVETKRKLNIIFRFLQQGKLTIASFDDGSIVCQCGVSPAVARRGGVHIQTFLDDGLELCDCSSADCYFGCVGLGQVGGVTSRCDAGVALAQNAAGLAINNSG